MTNDNWTHVSDKKRYGIGKSVFCSSVSLFRPKIKIQLPGLQLVAIRLKRLILRGYILRIDVFYIGACQIPGTRRSVKARPSLICMRHTDSRARICHVGTRQYPIVIMLLYHKHLTILHNWTYRSKPSFQHRYKKY